MKNQVSLKRVLIDGTILNVLLSVILYRSLYVNPVMWVHDYPPDIQAVVGEVEMPLVQTIIVGVTIGMAVMTLSLWMLRGDAK